MRYSLKEKFFRKKFFRYRLKEKREEYSLKIMMLFSH